MSQSLSSSYTANMGFMRPDWVTPDTERPGLLRAKTITMEQDTDYSETLDFHDLEVRDCLAPDAPTPTLPEMGFDVIDLSDRSRLQHILEAVRGSGHLTEKQASAIRRSFWGRSFRLSHGKKMRILYIAPEGFILRKTGPNGAKADPDEALTDMNGHPGSPSVHGDQDVFGTPIRQILKGLAPKILRHNTPDGVNDTSPLFLLNLWIPLQQIVRPLTLMDRRSLNKQQHQLRYALPTESFLDREEDRMVNDIWGFLYDDKQHWYIHSEMYADKAYVFDTLGLAHGACVLPGEKVAEQCFESLRSALQAVSAKDATAFSHALNQTIDPLPEQMTKALRVATLNMQQLIEQGRQQTQDILTSPEQWCSEVERAMDKVVRKSIEMRALCVVY